MKIVVCVKQVPDTAADKKFNAQNRLERTGIENILNPFDEYAVEEALRLKEAQGGEVTALCMGPETARETVRKAIAMGVTKGVVIADAALVGADMPATAYVLAQALKKLEWDLVFFGMESTDARAGLVPAAVAEHLGVPLLGFASKFIPGSGEASIHRMTAEGYDVVASDLPCLVSVTRAINEPRYPSLKGIMASKKAELNVWSLADIGADASRAAAKTEVVSIAPPQPRPPCVIVKDDGNGGAVAADFLVQRKIL